MTYKIYTKTGDKGETSLIGGVRVPKFHPRIEAYGTLDELNAWLGLIACAEENNETNKFLIRIQSELFTAGSHLASMPGSKMKLPELQAALIVEVEHEIDKMEAQLPPLKNFILPGGHPHVSNIHIARCVCRRAERLCVALAMEESVDEIIIQLLNRMSDFLFVYARYTGFKLQVPEIPWNSGQ